MNNEEKILYKVLQQASRNEPLTAAPDDAYIKALETIGFIKRGWDTELTEMGTNIYRKYDDYLSNLHYNGR